MRVRTLSLAALACLGLLAANGGPPQTIQETKLLTSDGAAGDHFGDSVSVSGDVAAVGAFADDDSGSYSGSAYVYRFDGTNWMEEAKLLASDGAAEERFGDSVSVSGDVLLVGTPNDDDNGFASGSAYVYRFDGTNWVKEAKLLASDGQRYGWFGGWVSVSGDVVVVGAEGDDDNSGSAYVFRHDGTNWSEEQKLTASDGAAADYFGARVSVSGDVAVVGAYWDDDNGDNSGSAYVYRFDGTNWVEEAKLLASDGAAGDHFGGSVSVASDVAVVGANRDDAKTHDDDTGSAYLYRFDGTNWVEEAKLLASDGAAGDHFGVRVSVSGDVAVVSAYLDDDHGGDSGAAYVYRFDGLSWVEEAKLLASDGAANDHFGLSVSVSGDVAAVGASGDDDNGEDSGSAYVFSNLGSVTACSDKFDNDGDGRVDYPDDRGCEDTSDSSENSPFLACDDGFDNDGDGFLDFPADPGCTHLSDQSEGIDCDDGIDNDDDGLIDYPDDLGCRDAASGFESSATFQVDSEMDDGDALAGDGACATSSGTCTLRAAIQETNAVPGEHAIVVPAGYYGLTIGGVEEDGAATGDLDITNSLDARGTSVAITGAGAQNTLIDAAEIDRVLEIHGSLDSVEISGVTIMGGFVEGEPFEVEGRGGGILANAPLTIRDSTISHNFAREGGGIFANAELRLHRVTVSNNSAIDGGALYGNHMEIVNSTISGNATAFGCYWGCSGAIVEAFDAYGWGGLGHVTLVNSTVADNSEGQNGLGRAISADLFLSHSIVANHGLYENCSSIVASGGYNLDSDGSCNLTDPTDLPNTDPMLGFLRDNGGPTFTHALLPRSPVVDAIPLADCTYDDDRNADTPELPLATDQRGVPRPQGEACDIGAYEMEPGAPTTTVPTTTTVVPTTTTTLPPSFQGDVPMCKSKRGRQMTVLVPPSKVQRSLARGFTHGECENATNGHVLCKTKRGKRVNVLVPESKLQRALDKGFFTPGECGTL